MPLAERSPTDRGDEPGDRAIPATWLPDAIIKHRHTFYVVLLCLFLAAFNGQWRVGRDSSIYRGLGHALATGQGYRFGEFGSHQTYPGLPVVLAGLEKVFGQTALPALLLMHLFSFGVLFFTYKLVRLRFPMWVAVAVTCWVGVNSWFLELTNELRDDIPFLCGLMMALYGWERLRVVLGMVSDTTPLAASLATSDAAPATPQDAPQAERPSEGSPVEYGRASSRGASLVKPLLILLSGLFLAAVMRPTFWILAIACVMVCGIGLVTGPRRRFYAGCLGILLVVWVAVALLDPRVRGFNPFAGGYERDAGVALRQVEENLPRNTVDLLDAELSYAFFGQKWAPGLTQLVSVLLIGSSLLLLRVNPLWTLLVLLTVAVTVVMKPVPRYFVMILPLLALSWLLLLVEIGRRLGPRGFVAVLLFGVVTMNAMNIARSVKVIGEQRSGERLVDGPKWRAVTEMSRNIAELVPPGAKVIAPDAPIVHYLSGREAVMRRDIIPVKKSVAHWPRHVGALGIEYAVFPPRLYDEAETPIRQLMERGVIVPTARVAYVGKGEEEMVLARVEIREPPPGKDWRRNPTTRPMTARTTVAGTTRPSAEQIARKRRHQAAERRAVAEAKRIKQEKIARAERLERQQKKELAEKREARERKARKARHARAKAAGGATQPAATQPAATQPSSSSSSSSSSAAADQISFVPGPIALELGYEAGRPQRVLLRVVLRDVAPFAVALTSGAGCAP